MIKLIPFLLFFFFAMPSHAQKAEVLQSQWKAIKVNGDLSEWGDTLTYYFSDQDFHYSISNDDEYLYVAIQVKDIDKQVQATFNGFQITVNPDGKKRDGPSLIFPLPDRAAFRALSNQEFDKPKDLRKGALSTIRAFYVQNYLNILDGPISLDNNYGIKAAVLIDSADHLCYESAIRLDQLNLTRGESIFAINLKINGLISTQYNVSRPMRSRRGSRYGNDGYGYDRRPRSVVQTREEPGTWQLIQLAEQP